jgi:hypothetical protein
MGNYSGSPQAGRSERGRPKGQGPEVRRSAASGGIIAHPGECYTLKFTAMHNFFKSLNELDFNNE